MNRSGKGSIQIFVGRRRQQQSASPTTKDALVLIQQLPKKKIIRVVTRSKLVLGETIDGKARQNVELNRMAKEIEDEEAKTKVRLKINGMIYFNLEDREVVQVLEGKPIRIHEALKHIVRDVRHDDLIFELEKKKVKKRFKKWGSAWISNTQQWKLVRLMLPTEEEWKRLAANLARSAANVSYSRNDSLAIEMEARQAKKKLQGNFIVKRKPGLFSCFDADVEEKLEVNPKFRAADRKRNKERGLHSRRGSVVNGSVTRSNRVSISRSSVLDVLNAEETGFVENVMVYQEQLEALREGTDEIAPKYAKAGDGKHDKSLKSLPKFPMNGAKSNDSQKFDGNMNKNELKGAGNHYTDNDENNEREIGSKDAVAGSTNQDDYVTSLQLDPSGNYIAIGDSQGRIGIFDASESNGVNDDPYQFYEEFVSHHPDFDTLYSRRIPTNIIAVEWLKKESRSLHVLATNEKTIKLWRLKEVHKEGQQTTIIPVLCNDFSKGHQRFFIHSLSAICDGEMFISSDELMLNLWHLERPDSSFALIDELPEDDMIEVNRIITSAKADPTQCHRILYTTSVNEVNICDLRARCMQNRPAMLLQAPIKGMNASMEIQRELQCITDADFARDGNGFTETKSSNQNGCMMHGCLVDDFRVAVNSDASGVVTGSYDDYFVAYDLLHDRKKWLQARHAHDFLSAEMPRMSETGRKVLHVDWHDERDIITVASSHSVYVYEKKVGAEPETMESKSNMHYT
eukprot:jgi/Bigna1/125853/aug1.1_g561